MELTPLAQQRAISLQELYGTAVTAICIAFLRAICQCCPMQHGLVQLKADLASCRSRSRLNITCFGDVKHWRRDLVYVQTSAKKGTHCTSPSVLEL